MHLSFPGISPPIPPSPLLSMMILPSIFCISSCKKIETRIVLSYFNQLKKPIVLILEGILKAPFE